MKDVGHCLVNGDHTASGGKGEGLLAVDASFQNIQLFNAQGRLLMFFPGEGGGPGAMSMPAEVVIDTTNLALYEERVRPGLEAKYLIFVSNQVGPDKVSVYAFVGQ